MIRLLLRIGLVNRRADGTIRWPFHVSPWWIWKVHFLKGPRFGIFRNVPGVIKWLPGRMLPRRWGFFIIGFEVGDRG